MNEKKDISMETKEEGLQEQILAERFSPVQGTDFPRLGRRSLRRRPSGNIL